MSNIIPPLISSSPPPMVANLEEEDDDFGEFPLPVDVSYNCDGKLNKKVFITVSINFCLL